MGARWGSGCCGHRAYETIKMRLLDGSHMAMAYVGALAGFTTDMCMKSWQTHCSALLWQSSWTK